MSKTLPTGEEIERMVQSVPPDAKLAPHLIPDEWNEWWPQLRADYGSATARDIAKQVAAIRKRRSENDFLSYEVDWDAEHEPVPWLIKGLVPSGVSVAVWGLKEAGKSFVTTDLACSLANGLPWLGHEVVKSNVLLLQIEDPKDMVHNRITAWMLTHPEVTERPRTYVHNDFTFFGGWFMRTVETEDGYHEVQEKDHGQSHHVTKLIETIREFDFDVVIIDNLAAGQNDTSNMSDSDVAAVMHAISKIVGAGVTLFVVAHSNQQDDKIAGLTKQENLINTALHVRWLRNRRVVEVSKSKGFDKTTKQPIQFQIVDSGLTVEDQAIGVVKYTGHDDDAERYIVAAMGIINEPTTKRAIDAKIRELGHKIDRNRCFKLIDELADDPTTSVVRSDKLFTLGGMDASIPD